MKNRFTHLWQLLGQTISAAKVYLQGYKSYKVVLKHDTPLNPPYVLQELDNSLGLEVTYFYMVGGVYGAQLSKALFQDSNYTIDNLLYSMTLTPETLSDGINIYNFTTFTINFDAFLIATTESVDNAGSIGFPTAKDGLLSNYSTSVFEIRVYNK